MPSGRSLGCDPWLEWSSWLHSLILDCLADWPYSPPKFRFDLHWTFEIAEMANFLKYSRPAVVCREIASGASPSHSARMSLIFAVTRNVARAAGSSRSTRTWPCWVIVVRDIGTSGYGISQLPSHVSVKTFSSAIEIVITHSFSWLNCIPRGSTTCLSTRKRDDNHLSSASSSESSWTSQQKQQNKRKVLTRSNWSKYKWYVGVGKLKAKSGIARYSNSSPHCGIEMETISPCPFQCLMLQLLDRLLKFLASTNMQKH